MAPNGNGCQSGLAGKTRDTSDAALIEKADSATEDNHAHRFLSICGELLEDISFDESLVEQGIDSLTAVQLQRRISAEWGRTVPLTHFLDDRPVREVAEQIVTYLEEEARTQSHGADHTGGKGAEHRTEDSDRTQRFFAPLTPVQATYWVGREDDYPLGGISTRFYMEHDIDLTQSCDDFSQAFTRAWNTVVRRHGMLRATVSRDGNQHVHQTVPDQDIPLHRSSDVEAVRRRLAYRTPDLSSWPVHDVELSALADRRVRVHFGFEVTLIDFAGIMRVLEDIGAVLAGEDIGAERDSFLDYVSDSDRMGLPTDRSWWKQQAPALPPGPLSPELWRGDVGSVGADRFHRHEHRIPSSLWKRIIEQGKIHGASASGILLAVAAHALRAAGARREHALATTFFSPESVGEAPIGDYTRTAVVNTGTGVGSFSETARQATVELWQALDHSSVSSAEIMRMRGGGDDRLPEYPFVFTSALGRPMAEKQWPGRYVWGISRTPQVVVDMLHWEDHGDLVLAWDCVDELLPEGFAQRALGSAVAVLAELADADAWLDSGRVADPWLRPVEPSRTDTTAHPGIHGLLDRTLATDDETCAVVDGQGQWSRAELDKAAEQVIAALNMSPEATESDPVLVVMGKSRRQIAAVLGVVRAGMFYIPVDPAWPAARVSSIIRRSGARICITDPEVDVPEQLTRIDPFDTDLADNHEHGISSGRTDCQPHALAYTIFTSGSTGEPKGVAIEHGQARTTIDDINDRCALDVSDVVLGLSALSFDLSVWDIFGVLGAGGRLVLPDDAQLRDPSAWLQLCEHHGVSVWNTAPPLLEMLVDFAEINPEAAQAALGTLRLVLLSGDWIPLSLPRRLRQLAPNAQVYSLGGATEASIWSIHHLTVDDDEQGPSIPYGRALSGQYFRILDDEGMPVPIGSTGNLFIGGDGVARGYLGDSEKTNERFAVHPWLKERLYDTGDTGMWLDNGEIRFLGRVDRQVKINGYRIELGEIDAGLNRCDCVKAAIATAPVDTAGRKRLVAHVVGQDSDVTPARIRAEASKHLPPYMIPARFVIHERLPVTANGKVDYRALPNPWITAEASGKMGIPSEQVATSEESRLKSEETGGTTAEVPVHPEAHSPAPSLNVDATADTSQLTPVELGINSLDIVRVANDLEDATGQRPALSDLLSTPWAQTLSILDGSRNGNKEEASDNVHSEESHEVDAQAVTPQPDVFQRALALGADVTVTVPVNDTPLEDQFISVGTWLKDMRSQLPMGIALSVSPPQDGLLCSVALSPNKVSPAFPAVTATQRAPLTELQLGYLVGRADTWLGETVAPHYYTEVDCLELDPERMQSALDAVIAAHPALCLTVDEDGYQRIDPHCRPVVQFRDLRESVNADAELEHIRARGQQGVVDPTGHSWLTLSISRLSHQWRVHLGIDMLFCDVMGAHILVQDLLRAYEGHALQPEAASFLDFARRLSEHAQRGTAEPAQGHAPRRVDRSSSKETLLPCRETSSARFARVRCSLDGVSAQRLSERAKAINVTQDALIVTVLSSCLGAMTGSRPQPLVATVLARPKGHERSIGEYTSTVVVEPIVGSIAQRASHATQVLVEAAAAVSRAEISSPRVDSIPPIVYSSGLATGGDQSELLGDIGTTVFAQSSTPQVLIDVQAFRTGSDITFVIDHAEDALQHGTARILGEALIKSLNAVASGEWILTEEFRGSELFPQPHLHPVPVRWEAFRGVAATTSSQNTNIPARDTSAATIRVVAESLEKVLGRTIAASDYSSGFFELGASSVDLIQLRSALLGHGFELTILDVFSYPSIAALGSALSSRTGERSPHRDTIDGGSEETSTRGQRRRAIAMALQQGEN